MRRLLRWLLFGKKLDFIGVLRLTPGDVLVARINEELTSTDVEQLTETISKVIGRRNSVLVLDNKWQLEVIRGYEKETTEAEK